MGPKCLRSYRQDDRIDIWIKPKVIIEIWKTVINVNRTQLNVRKPFQTIM